MITFFILIIGTSSFAEIEIKYDRFKDVTDVKTIPHATRGTKLQPELMLFGRYPGKTPSRPQECIFTFVLKGSSWEYLNCYSLSCLADGSRIELPPSTHNGRTGKGYVLEFILVKIPFSVIEHFSKCKKVEFKLCNTEFSLIEQDMQDLRTFVEAFPKK